MNAAPASTPSALPDPASPAPPPERKRRVLFVVVLMTVSALAAVCAAEVGLRLFLPVTDVQNSFWDPVIGVRRVPVQTGRFVRAGRINATYRFNAQGWNHPRDYNVERTRGTTRVCVIGDSYVEALHVNPDESLTLVGERTMSRPERPAEWYAFGSSGYGLAQYYLILHHYVAFYRPDAVVIVLVSNDVYDSSPYLVSSGSQYATLDVELDGGVRLFPARRFEPSLRSRVFFSSAIARFLFAQHAIHRPRGGTRELRKGIFLRDEAGGRVLMGDGLSFEQRSERSWKHAEDVLRLIRDECRAMKATLLLAYVGNDYELRAIYEKKAYEAVPKEKDPYCMSERLWEMGPDWWEPIAKRLEVPYVDLFDALAEEVRKTGERHDFGEVGDDHYCQLGHRVAGRTIAARLDELLRERRE